VAAELEIPEETEYELGIAQAALELAQQSRAAGGEEPGLAISRRPWRLPQPG
jgi:hypothetical protein